MLLLSTSPPPPPTQQPQGQLGFEFPLVVGIGIGLMIASLRNQSQQFPLPEFKNTNRDYELVPSAIAPTKNASMINQSILVINQQFDWVKPFIKLPFRVISGMQGSGKSTLERFIISELIKDGWHVICINPETNPNVWEGVEVLADVESINQFFTDFLELVRSRQQEARDMGIDEDDYLDKVVRGRSGRDGMIAIFLMETNTYEPHGVAPETWANFLKQCLTNIRKWGFTASLTAHSENQTSIGSKLAGFSDLLNSQPRIECIAVPNPSTGEATSSGEGWLKMKGIKDKNPIKIKLQNYPKTKKFGASNETSTNQSSDSICANESIISAPIIPQESPSNNDSSNDITRLAESIYKAFKGESNVKIYQIPRQSKPVRNCLEKQFLTCSMDNDDVLRSLHIILGILEYQGKAELMGKKDSQGLIIPSRDTEFTIIN